MSLSVKPRMNTKKRGFAQQHQQGIYNQILITRNIPININNIGNNIKETLETAVAFQIEGKCIVEGYIKPNTIEIITFSSGLVTGSCVMFVVVFQCYVCSPVEGMHIQCVAKHINKAGIRAEMKETPSPVVIFIARDHNYASPLFSQVKEDDEIKIRVIGQRFELNDKYISVIAELVESQKYKEGMTKQNKPLILSEEDVDIVNEPAELVNEPAVKKKKTIRIKKPTATALVPAATALVPAATALVPAATALVPAATALVPAALVPEEEAPEELSSDLYDNATVFRFYNKSAEKPLPGKGSGEQLGPEGRDAYAELARIPNWRQKLSNFWAAEFTLDGHKWQSVEHYYQGSKFKKNNKEFYLKFSLDSKDSAIAKDTALAKAAGGKSGKFNGEQVRPKNIVVDPDFFKTRGMMEKEAAIRAKFGQNEDLKALLLATKKAKLEHTSQGKPPVIFNDLMRVRREFAA